MSLLEKHFFGDGFACLKKGIPVLLVADVTDKGEIDDTISLAMYAAVENRGCVEVIGVVSIFGNGKSSTPEVHAVLIKRLAAMKIYHWPIFEGPHRRMKFGPTPKIDADDYQRLMSIAERVNKFGDVVIVELGPMTVSACLVAEKLVDRNKIRNIIGVGGRALGENFSTGRGVSFYFRDMNVDEDQAAMNYLVKTTSHKLKMVTYRTGVGTRMLAPEQTVELGTEITTHAYKRAKTLAVVGYGGRFPSWDTWTTSFFIKGGEERLGCARKFGRVEYFEGATKERRRLIVSDTPERNSRQFMVCHTIKD